MRNPFIPSCLAFGAFLLTGGFGLVSHATPGGDPIPTQLLNEPRDGDLNGPCSLCRVNSGRAAEDSSESMPTLDIYFEDDSEGMSGDIEITVLLDNGEFHYLTFEDVALAYKQVTTFDLPPVDGWDWDVDVKHMWIETVPAGS
ncbi:MAG: hypothetical protein AAF799_17860 [Myxococcota bacterium]